MGPVKIFVAGTITGFVVRPYVQRAAQSLLMSAIQSVEKTQNELDQVEKLKAEAEAAKAQALKLEEEARRLRDDALQAATIASASGASAPVTTPT